MQLLPGMAEAERTAALQELLPSLPEPLRGLGKALIQALHDHHQIPQVFSAFCSAAYVKPDWAGAASDFLAELFSTQEDLLAEMARIPDLIIELATGHITLTCMVASRWAARAEIQRLARLADALIATQSKMSGEGVVEVMLALATSLAITRHSRAEQLVAAAEPHATADQQEGLAEARLWLATGRIVRSCSQEARDLWDQRLRRSGQVWTWEAREEREALLQLADSLNDEVEGSALFKAILPRCWWDLATLRVKRVAEDTAAPTDALTPAPAPPPPPSPPTRPLSHVPEPERDLLPDMRWTPLPFLAGVVLGALSAAVIFLLAQPHRYASKAAPVAAGAAASQPAATTATASTPAPTTTGETAAADTFPSPATDSPPLPHNDDWRKEEIFSLTTQSPELAPTAAALKTGAWAENEAILKGESTVAPRDSAAYQKLLLWMHLDAPNDPEVRAQIPILLSALRQDDTLLDLWKKLIYDGSPNADDIRKAAKLQIHRNTESKVWTEPQVRTLEQIAGWSVATAAP